MHSLTPSDTNDISERHAGEDLDFLQGVVVTLHTRVWIRTVLENSTVGETHNNVQGPHALPKC